MKTFVFFLFLIATALAYPIWKGWQSFLDMRTTEAQIQKMVGWQDSVMYHDEVLSLSAKMAAITGDLTWDGTINPPLIKPITLIGNIG